MPESGIGGTYLFDDFRSGAQALVASANAPPLVIGNGTYTLVGQGLAESDSGGVMTKGGITLTATDEDEHAAGLTTRVCFDVGLMGTIVAETRLQQAALTTRQVFFGFSDVQTDLAILEGAIIKGDTVTLSLTASDIAGFLLASELSDAADWHAVYNGGVVTGETVSTNLDLDEDAVASTYQILRIEMDTNGTVRWFVDGKLKKTLAGAVSTTVDLCCSLIFEEKGSANNAAGQVDYLMVKADRDWAV